MCIFVCNLLFVYKASMCVNNTLALCALMVPGFISHITKNKVSPCIKPALFHIPQESCNLFLPAHLPPNNPPCAVPCSLSGLLGQYKERGSLHQSEVGGDGVKSQHHLHQKVRCICCFMIHRKHTSAIGRNSVLSIFFKSPPISLQITVYSRQYVFCSPRIPDHSPCGTDGRDDLQYQNHTPA